VRKDSLGRVMNPARAGSVTSAAVGARDDGSVGSAGKNATEPVSSLPHSVYTAILMDRFHILDSSPSTTFP
jgi:hypothetical protein